MSLTKHNLFTISEKSLPKISSPLHDKIFLTVSDDILFANSQIEKVNAKIYRKNYKILRPWEIGSVEAKKITEQLGKSNHLLLKEIKKKSRRNKQNDKDSLTSLDLKNQKYYTQEDLDKIFEASSIIKRINSRPVTKAIEDSFDLYTFAKQSKQLCKKNTLIELMKQERRKLFGIEKNISSALSKEQAQLDNDINQFDNYIEQINNKFKYKEDLLYKIILENKELNEKKKKCVQERRLIFEEIEKTIRNINNMKTYAEFVHKLLGGENKFTDSVYINKGKNNNGVINYTSKSTDNTEHNLQVYKNKEEELMETVKKTLDRFDFLLQENHGTEDEDTVLLTNPDNINYLFDSYESNILKDLIKIDSINKGTELDKIKYNNNLEELKNKIEEHQIEYDILKKEYNKLSEEVEKVNSFNSIDSSDFGSLCKKYVMEIYNEIHSKKNNKKKLPKITFNSLDNIKLNNIFSNQSILLEDENIIEITNKCLSDLSIMEDKINFYITHLEQFKNDPLMDIVIANKKLENKENKYLVEKQSLKDKEIEKAEKLNLKFNRFIIKGRRMYQEPVPLHIQRKIWESMKVIKEDDNDFELMKYT